MINFTLWLISSVMLLGITFAGVFGIFCLVIMLWTGCSFNEAVIKLREAVNDREQEEFSMDEGIKVDIWNTVKNIIGEKRFKRIVELSETPTAPMMCFTKTSRLPCVQIVVPYADENEKDVLEHMILNVVKRYLEIYEYKQNVIVDWNVRFDLNIPYLEIKYARNEKENSILNIIQNQRQQKLTITNENPIDDMDENDLDG